MSSRTKIELHYAMAKSKHKLEGIVYTGYAAPARQPLNHLPRRIK